MVLLAQDHPVNGSPARIQQSALRRPCDHLLPRGKEKAQIGRFAYVDVVGPSACPVHVSVPFVSRFSRSE